MDLEEWELLPHDRFIDYHEDGEKKTFGESKRGSPNPKTMFNMNYFMCPSSPPKHSRGVPNQLVPVPIELEPATTIMDVLEDHVISKKDVISVVPIDLSAVVPSATMAEVKEADQDSVSQVFFKKMKENEFVDMKLDSPKSSNTKGTGFVPPQIDAGSTFNFDEKNDHQGYLGDQVLETTKITSPRIIKISENENSPKEEVNWEEDGSGLNLWKLSLTGIGAICTFGVAAATICIFIFGSHQRNRHHQQNQKLSFQIYTDDKRIKQVVHHATKLNEAIAAARGVPIARAHITYGGYYDGL